MVDDRMLVLVAALLEKATIVVFRFLLLPEVDVVVVYSLLLVTCRSRRCVVFGRKVVVVAVEDVGKRTEDSDTPIRKDAVGTKSSIHRLPLDSSSATELRDDALRLRLFNVGAMIIGGSEVSSSSLPPHNIDMGMFIVRNRVEFSSFSWGRIDPHMFLNEVKIYCNAIGRVSRLESKLRSLSYWKV